ncbi:hypothetical protein [Bdellovibrio sp. HCB337]|uniref:hypothetical protein n=1 Tax=Bdellovibrio sp. HCB337 TaxID=3394358 RepID=UPI0039A66F05
MIRFWIPAVLAIATISYYATTYKHKNFPTREPAFSLFKSQPLEDKDILEASSSSDLKAKRVRLLIDNDASFDSKIEAIRSARSGETIRLSYYIYSKDQSSALFLNELLQAAARGVRIKLMADFITNYPLLDLFTYLETQSRGMIQVRLYGRPTPLIVRDSMFLTTPCPPTSGKVKSTTCSDAKWAKLANSSPDFYARLMLSSLYSLNFDFVASAVLKGQLVDLAALTSGGNTSEEDKKQFIEFLKLAFNAKVKGDVLAGAKVLIAMQLYGDKLNPILNEILGRVPVSQKEQKSYSDWEHITDFTHHKILMVGDRFVQLGGRNIENSYHMKRNELTDKYIFMDTDVAVDLDRGGNSIAVAYDRLWNFSQMTIPVQEARNLMPNELVSNSEIANEVWNQCLPKNYQTEQDRQTLVSCFEGQFYKHSKYKNLNTRMTELATVLNDGVQAYKSQYLPKKAYAQTWKKSSNYEDELSNVDISHLLLGYIENVHYDKSKKELERIYGSVAGKETKNGKYIHHLWYLGLQNTCALAAKEKREKRVIIHSAYFLPPAILMRGFSKMMDGTWDCRNVHVSFVTNSPETTDLNHINIASRYQMAAFFKVYQNRRRIYGSISDSKSAKFDYHEYLKDPNDRGLSLHSKVSVLGDDLIVGSANADVRSYYMDTNNGFFLRGAKDTVSQYAEWVDNILKDSTKVRDLTSHFSSPGLTVDKIYSDDKKILENFLATNELGKKLSPTMKEKFFKGIYAVANFVSETTEKILVKDSNPSEAEQAELEQKFDRAMQLL